MLIRMFFLVCSSVYLRLSYRARYCISILLEICNILQKEACNMMLFVYECSRQMGFLYITIVQNNCHVTSDSDSSHYSFMTPDLRFYEYISLSPFLSSSFTVLFFLRLILSEINLNRLILLKFVYIVKKVAQIGQLFVFWPPNLFVLSGKQD